MRTATKVLATGRPWHSRDPPRRPPAGPDVARHGGRGRTRAAGRRSASSGGRRLDACGHHRCAAVGGLAVARADGLGSRRRLHVRLDREPLRPRHEERATRIHPEWQTTRRGRRDPRSTRACPACASRRSKPERALVTSGSEAGTWVWAFSLDRPRRTDAAAEPEPDRACRTRQLGDRIGDGGDGAGLAYVMDARCCTGSRSKPGRLAGAFRTSP